MIAEAMIGRGDAAFDYYKRINPSAREEIGEIHRCEPYVYAQMIAGKRGAHPRRGQELLADRDGRVEPGRDHPVDPRHPGRVRRVAHRPGAARRLARVHRHPALPRRDLRDQRAQAGRRERPGQSGLSSKGSRSRERCCRPPRRAAPSTSRRLSSSQRHLPVPRQPLRRCDTTRVRSRLILAAVKPLRVLLFDVFGTLVDWRSSLIDIAEATAARSQACGRTGRGIVDDWRRAYQPAMDRVRQGAAVARSRFPPARNAGRRARPAGHHPLPPPTGKRSSGAGGSCGPGPTAGTGSAACAASTSPPRCRTAISRCSPTCSSSLTSAWTSCSPRSSRAATSPMPGCTSRRFACSIARPRKPGWWPHTPPTCARPPSLVFARSSSIGPWSGVRRAASGSARPGWPARDRRAQSPRRSPWLLNRRALANPLGSALMGLPGRSRAEHQPVRSRGS